MINYLGSDIMPIKVPDNLPAIERLIGERIFAMGESRAFHQDIRYIAEVDRAIA